MPVTPPTITALPTPPQRTDPANFSARADAFLTALPTFATETNNSATATNTNATDAQASAVLAGSLAANALASANAAAAASAAINVTANVGAWVSGTTYAVGTVVYSPINWQNYRRIVAGAGTTDPSSDIVNWRSVGFGPANIGSGANQFPLNQMLGSMAYQSAEAISIGRLVVEGDISAPAWTTAGLRQAMRAATLTDTTSSGTVAAAYTNAYGGNTIAASSATTYTVYATSRIAGPTAGTNVTIGTRLALSLGASLGLDDDANVVLGTGAGTRFGTSVSQKLGFWNVTPVVQPASANQAAVATTAATQTTPWGFTTQAQADGIVTLLNEIRAALVAVGIIKGAA